MQVVFIGYARENKQQALEIAEILRYGNYQPWIDEDLVPGKQWKPQLLEAIKKCDLFLCVMSPDWLRSEWCQWEFKQAIRLGKPIIPVHIAEMDNLPDDLNNIQWVDYSHGPAQALSKLKSALENAVPIHSPLTRSISNSPAGIPSRVDDKPLPATKTTFENLDAKLEPAASDMPSYHPINDALTSEGWNIFIANTVNPANSDFFTIWKAILEADFFILDITSPQPDHYIELGMAIAVSKPVILLARTDTAVPQILDTKFILRYEDEAELPLRILELTQSQDFQWRPDVRGGYCHYCDEISCKALFRSVQPDKYLVIADSRLTHLSTLDPIEDHIAGRTQATPPILTNLSDDICSLREAVFARQFAICLADNISRLDSLILIGLAIGHGKPRLFLYDRLDTIPLILRTSDRTYMVDAEPFRIGDFRLLDSFLEDVYPALTVREYQQTRRETSWEKQTRIRQSVRGIRGTTEASMLGDIRIFRVDSGGIRTGDPITLPSRKQELVFGRSGSLGVIELRGEDASRFHFRVFRDQDTYYVEDLGSANGTFINDSDDSLPKQSPLTLHPGDIITAGDSRFFVWDEHDLAEVQPPPAKNTHRLLQRPIIIELRDIRAPKQDGISALLSEFRYQIILQVTYSLASPIPQSQEPKRENVTETRMIQTQAYYPLGEVLTRLKGVLGLYSRTLFYFRLGTKLLDPKHTFLDLGIGDGSLLDIVPDEIGWCIEIAQASIDHCQENLTYEEDGPRKIYHQRPNFRYVEFTELVNEEYTARNGHSPASKLLKPTMTVYCPACKNMISISTIVAVKQKLNEADMVSS